MTEAFLPDVPVVLLAGAGQDERQIRFSFVPYRGGQAAGQGCLLFP